MKRLVLFPVLFFLCTLPALAQGPLVEPSWAVLLPATTPATRHFSPYYGAAYPRGCAELWRHERDEEVRLRDHQWRERQRCGRWSTSGRCRNLAWHERDEWQRLRAHQRAQRARWGCW